MFEDVDEIERIPHPFVVAPVRRVNFSLDRSAMERTVWKAVDEGNVQAMIVEETPEVLNVVLLE